MEKVNGQFLMLYNVFRDENGRFHLSVDELYLYSVLKRLAIRSDETIVNVDVLDQYTRNTLQLAYNKRDTLNKKVIREVLMSLIEKGVIHCNGEPTKNNTMLNITFEDFGGHEQISYDKFKQVTDRTLFYIYFVVASWKKVDEGFRCSTGRWAEILGMSPSTAEKYVKLAVEEGLIYVNIGDYSDKQVRDGQKQRDPNTYSIYPFKEEDKTPAQKKLERKDTPEPIGDVIGNDDYSFNTGNWLNYGRLDVSDYVIYLENIDNKDFIAECNKSRQNISKKDKSFKHRDKDMMEEAKAIIENKKLEREKQLKIERVKDGQIIVERLSSGAASPFETEEVLLESFNQVKLDDDIYYIDFKGDLEKMSVKSLVTGWTDDMYLDYYHYSDDVKEEILSQAIVIVDKHGVFDYESVHEELKGFRKQIAKEYNRNREHDVVHEGDRIHEDESTAPTNISLLKRKRSYQPPIKIQL